MDKYLTELYNAIGITIVEALQQSAMAQNPSLSDSKLINSISYRIENGMLYITMPDYAMYVEYGLKPGTNKGVWVPIQSLIEWIKKKNIQPRNGNVNSFAYAVQRKIFNVGINGVKARPFIQQGMQAAEQEVQDLLSIELDKIVDIELQKILK